MTRFRFLFACLLVISALVPLLAEESATPGAGGEARTSQIASETADKIRESLSSGSFKPLELYLRSASPEDLPIVEKEVIARAREYFDGAQYDTASDLVDSVLQNDLDNGDAQRFMIEIQDTKKRVADREALERELKAEQDRKDAERLAAERKEAERLEAARLERERIERERSDAERIEAERVARERAEADRIAREKAEREKKLAWMKTIGGAAEISPIVIGATASGYRESDDSKLLAGYGFGVALEGLCRHPMGNAIADAWYECQPVGFGGGSSRQTLGLRVSYGYPGISFPVYASLGIKSMRYFDSPDVDDVLFSEFTCPTLGVGIERYKLPFGFEASGRAVWLPLSFMDSLVVWAMDIDLDARYTIRELKGIGSLFASAGSVTTVIVAKGGTETLESFRLAIGVARNE